MGKFNKHIIVVGSARSGTSWLAETIGKQHRYRMLFEPDHEFQTSKGHLLSDQYITSNSGFEAGNKYLKQVFSNKVDCNWIAQNSNRKWKRHLWPFIPKKFVIKFVRCNLLIQYIQQKFHIPVIYLLRNPYNVLASQQRVKFPWLYELHHFANNETLVTLLVEKFQYDITQWNNLNNLEKLTLRWCIENVVPLQLQKAQNTQFKFVRYEELRNDINVFLQLCADLNLEPIASINEEYTKPSSKTHPKSTIRDVVNTETGFLQEELTQINAILDTFEVTLYPRKLS